jgi:hypothetical protein
MAVDVSDAIVLSGRDVFAKRACVESAIIMRSNLTVASCKTREIDQCRRSSLTDFRCTLQARTFVQLHLSTTTVPVMCSDLGPFLWMKCPETEYVFQVSLRGSGGLPGIS